MTDRLRPCEAILWNGLGRHGCSKRGRVERDGKWYCGTHDPVSVAGRRAKSEAEWRKKETERTAGHRFAAFAHQLAQLAIREPETFPPNAQPIVQQLVALSPPPPGQSR